MGLVVRLDVPPVGSDFAQDLGQTPAYDPDAGASAPLSFPWVYACIRVRASSIARLPFQVYRWSRGGNREYLDDHWLATLRERPNSYTPEHVLTQEIQADLDAIGDAYLVIVGVDVGATPAAIQRAAQAGALSIHRVPPKRMRVITSEWGVEGYEFKDGYGVTKRLDARLVVHVRRPSFRDTPSERFYGDGAVRPLSSLLSTELAQTKRDTENAAKGRPTVALSPADSATRWTRDQVQDVRAAYSATTREAGGAFISSGHVKIEPLSFPPSEFASGTVRDSNRSATLAALRVPPVLVGLETANYATAREQKGVFWESIADDAVLHGWAWTEIARRAGERDIYAELDLSGVQELAAWKVDAFARANSFWLMGADIDAALRSQGLHAEADLLIASAKPSKVAAEPAAEPRSEWWPPRLVARAEQPPPIDDEPARAERWRAIDAQLLSVGERNLNLAVRAFLKAQAERVSAALEEEAGRGFGLAALHRDAFDAMLGRIFDEVAERKRLDDAVRADIRRILSRAFDQGQLDLDLGEGVTYNADRIDELVDEALGQLVRNVTQATKNAVGEIVRAGLAEGQTIADMQFNLMRSEGFSAMRALRIARTETTRSTSAGTEQAYNQARAQVADQGIRIKKQWLSSRDDATRDAHFALDGQTVETDGHFIVPHEDRHGNLVEPTSMIGMIGSAPGQFSHPAMVVNCRCALVPVVERD